MGTLFTQGCNSLQAGRPGATARLGKMPFCAGSSCPGEHTARAVGTPHGAERRRPQCVCEDLGVHGGLTGGRVGGRQLLKNRSIFLQHFTDVKCITTLGQFQNPN